MADNVMLVEEVLQFESDLIYRMRDTMRKAFITEKFIGGPMLFKYKPEVIKPDVMKWCELWSDETREQRACKVDKAGRVIDNLIDNCIEIYSVLPTSDRTPNINNVMHYIKSIKAIIDKTYELEEFDQTSCSGYENLSEIFRKNKELDDEILSMADNLKAEMFNQVNSVENFHHVFCRFMDEMHASYDKIKDALEQFCTDEEYVTRIVKGYSDLVNGTHYEIQTPVISEEEIKLAEQKKQDLDCMNGLNEKYQRVKCLGLEFYKYSDEKIQKMESDLQGFANELEEAYGFPLTAKPSDGDVQKIKEEFELIESIISSHLSELDYHIKYGVEDIGGMLSEFDSQDSQPLVSRKNSHFENLNAMLKDFLNRFGDGLGNAKMENASSYVLAYNEICKIYDYIMQMKAGLQYPELNSVFSK